MWNWRWIGLWEVEGSEGKISNPMDTERYVEQNLERDPKRRLERNPKRRLERDPKWRLERDHKWNLKLNSSRRFEMKFFTGYESGLESGRVKDLHNTCTAKRRFLLTDRTRGKFFKENNRQTPPAHLLSSSLIIIGKQCGKKHRHHHVSEHPRTGVTSASAWGLRVIPSRSTLTQRGQLKRKKETTGHT